MFLESLFLAEFDENTSHSFLSEDEFNHATRVFRLKQGDSIEVCNGKGISRVAVLGEASKKGCPLKMGEIVRSEKAPKFHLAQAWLKGRDLEDVIDAVAQTELASVQILLTDHSQEFKKQDFSASIERLKNKSSVATKQSRKLWTTSILNPVPILPYLEKLEHTALLLDMEQNSDFSLESSKEYSLFCGPEGGFSAQEIDKIRQKGLSLNLGNTRLRATHAAFFALGKLQAFL